MSLPSPQPDFQLRTPYKKGDFIGEKYEVSGILGRGGFGIVYRVYSHETGDVLALKTFRDEYLADQEVRRRFHQEASIWVQLGYHPYLVHANFIEEVWGRLFIGMEYISPNEDGLNTLEGYLRRRFPDLAQSLRWAIQVCHGMEYAYSKGVRSHRDLKPSNIMIGQNHIARITDFGLAGVIGESPTMHVTRPDAQPVCCQTEPGVGFGTPTHMSPEQFENAAECDERSDIYSFGIVLYQMAAGGQLPFSIPAGANWQRMRRIHNESTVPRLNSPLSHIIEKCVEKLPEKRYQTFKDLRKELGFLLEDQDEEVIIPPRVHELMTGELNNKGHSLISLGRYEEAMGCLDKALAVDPNFVAAWHNKGNCLENLGQHEDAIRCYDKALAIAPSFAPAWNNKGVSFANLGRHEDAILLFEKALELDPRFVTAWQTKGASFDDLGRHEEAIQCYDQALQLDQHSITAWYNKGNSLDSLGRYEEAIFCYDQALSVDPFYVSAWNNKSKSLSHLGRYEEAIICCDRALRLNPDFALAWNNKGSNLNRLGRDHEAISCYDKALELSPRYVLSWSNKAISLNSLEQYEEAIQCLNRAIELDPHYANAWNSKGNSLNHLGRFEDALLCFDRVLELDAGNADAWNNKGVVLYSLNRYKDAVFCFQKTLTYVTRHVNAWYMKGLAEDKLGQWREAAHCYRQFLKLAAPHDGDKIEWANRRLRELEDK